jgi:hypothetical protein
MLLDLAQQWQKYCQWLSRAVHMSSKTQTFAQFLLYNHKTLAWRLQVCKKEYTVIGNVQFWSTKLQVLGSLGSTVL